MKESLAKNVTVSTGLSAYDLQAPAKNLYPDRHAAAQFAAARRAAQSRRRRALAHHHLDHRLRLRRDGLGAGRPAHRQHDLFGARPQVAPYLTLGEEDTVTFEAEAAAQGFEDLNATATLRLLQKTMRKEETALLGGNASLALGTPARADALSASGTGATLPAATYSVIVVALTFEGYRNSSARRRRRHDEDHHRQRRQHLYAERRLLDAQRQRDAGGDARPDADRDRARSSTAPSPTPGTSAPPAPRPCRRSPRSTARPSARRSLTGQQAATAITADNSRNATLAFDGLLTVGFNPANSAYVQALATGTGGNRHVPHRLRPRLGRRDRQHAGRRCGTTIGCRRRCSTSTRRSRRTSPPSA